MERGHISGEDRGMSALLDNLPHDWELSTLGSLNNHKTPTLNPKDYADETFEYYSIPHFQRDQRPSLTTGAEIESLKLLLKPKTVLFGKLNPRVEKVWRVAESSGYRQIGSTEWITILPTDRIDANFLYFLEWSDHVMPIAKTEYASRIMNAQAAMQREGIAAMWVHAGTNMTYFTGTKWHPSERMVGAIIPAVGAIEYLAPYFEQDTVRDFMVVDGPVNVWHEHESPYQLFIDTLKRMGLDRNGKIGISEDAPFFIVDGVAKCAEASEAAFEIVNAKRSKRRRPMRPPPAKPTHQPVPLDGLLTWLDVVISCQASTPTHGASIRRAS